MDLSDSENFLRKIYYAYIREPLMKIKERWLAYFAEFMIDEGPSASDAESEIHSSMEVMPKNVLRSSGGTCEKSEHHLSRFSYIITVLGTVFAFSHIWYLPGRINNASSPGTHLVMCFSIIVTFGYMIFFANLSMGQYTSSTAITFFRSVPLIQGVGYTMFVFTYIFAYQYGVKLSTMSFAYSASFNSILPWSRCPEGEYPELNITKCSASSDKVDMRCPKRTITFNATEYCMDKSTRSSVYDDCCRETSNCDINTYDLCHAWAFPADYYTFTKYVRYYDKGSPNFARFGPPEFEFLIYFGAIWSLVFIFCSINQKWSRLAMIIVHPCIIICLLILLPFSLGLNGINKRLDLLFTVSYEDLASLSSWGRALNDSVCALGVPTIVIFFLGSLSRFRSPCHLDTILILFIALVTNFLATVVTLSASGYVQNKCPTITFDSVNPMIFFIFEILTRYPVPWLSTIVFSSFIIAAGVVALSGMVVAMSATISDATHIQLKDRRIVSFLLVFSFFLLSVPYIYRNSNLIHDSIFYTVERVGCSCIGIIELLALNVYGVGLFCENISFMLGFYPNRIFRYLYIICPFAFAPPAAVWHTRFDFVDHFKNLAFLIYGAPISMYAPAALGIIFAVLVYTFKLDLFGIVRVSPSHGPKNEELKIQREEYRTKRRIF